MLVVFVHGWGVRTPDYGPLPQHLRALEIWLSDYITANDNLTLDDLAAAFERARQTNFPGVPFACVTHSTGGPVIRTWLDAHAAARLLTHLVMLAPPNHGSALAQLGKSRLARMHFWLHGAEPGEKILDWLQPGSAASWALNTRALDLDHGAYIFVLTGTAIDRKLYDHLNSYTGERGSDGVVRAAAANMNYTLLRVSAAAAEARRTPPTAVGILPASHSGERGILHHPTTAHWVERCLRVSTPAEYRALAAELPAPAHQACAMLIFRVLDTTGAPIDDFDLLLTAGPTYSPDHLPRGFFLDRQRSANAIAYYVDHTALARTQLGFRLIARPHEGPVHYAPVEYRGALPIRPHETVLVEITCRRRVQPEVFLCSPAAR